MPKTPKSYARKGHSPYPKSVVRTTARQSVRRELFPTQSRRNNRVASKGLGANEVGAPIGMSATKTVSARETDKDLTEWTLYSISLTTIAKGVEEAQRERDIVNLRGFNVRFNIRMNDTTGGILATTDVVYCNVAIIAPKQGTTVTNDDFFRGNLNSNVRSANFATNLEPLLLHTLPINTDLYTVLKHDRFQLQPASQGHDKWRKEMSYYLPVKRQIAFDTSGQCQNPVFLVYWISRGFRANGTGAQVLGSANFVVTSHFRDIY